MGKKNMKYLIEIIKSKWDISPQKRKVNKLEEAKVEATKKAKIGGKT